MLPLESCHVFASSVDTMGSIGAKQCNCVLVCVYPSLHVIEKLVRLAKFGPRQILELECTASWQDRQKIAFVIVLFVLFVLESRPTENE